MLNRIRFGLVAALVAVSMTFAAGALAQDKTPPAKADCGYCAAVQHVTTAMRCEGCKSAEKPCAHCQEVAKKVAATASCDGCVAAKKDGKPAASCAECTATVASGKEGECKFCAEKKMVADHTYCCDKCKGAKNAECKNCKKMREQVMAVDCADCAAKKKS